MIRFLCAVVVSFVLTAPLMAAELRVGVRTDAVSMSYQVTETKRRAAEALPGPLNEAAFAGYVVFICDRVLIELQRQYGVANLTVTPVPLKAYEIWPALDEGRVDIVCGPTTATLDRLQNRISSPPVFVSGVSFATQSVQSLNSCQPIVGYLKSSTAGSGALATILQNGEWPQDRAALDDFLSGGSSWEEALYADCTQAPASPTMEFETHDEMADAFCAGNLKYYIGDFEIMTRSLQAAKSRNAACEYTVSESTFSEERYVILGTARSQSGDSDAFVAHFFEILSRQMFFQPSVMDAAFRATFPLSQRSRKLDFLFWAMRGNLP